MLVLPFLVVATILHLDNPFLLLQDVIILLMKPNLLYLEGVMPMQLVNCWQYLEVATILHLKNSRLLLEDITSQQQTGCLMY